MPECTCIVDGWVDVCLYVNVGIYVSLSYGFSFVNDKDYSKYKICDLAFTTAMYGTK